VQNNSCSPNVDFFIIPTFDHFWGSIIWLSDHSWYFDEWIESYRWTEITNPNGRVFLISLKENVLRPEISMH
jgi:hypothetical protein